MGLLKHVLGSPSRFPVVRVPPENYLPGRLPRPRKTHAVNKARRNNRNRGR